MNYQALCLTTKSAERIYFRKIQFLLLCIGFVRWLTCRFDFALEFLLEVPGGHGWRGRGDAELVATYHGVDYSAENRS